MTEHDLTMRRLTPIGPSGVGMVPYGEGLHLTTSYAVEIDDPECPALLELHIEVIDGQPRCVELRCRRRPDGAPVTSEGLRRVALARYVRESVALYSLRVTSLGDGQVLVRPTGAADEPVLARAASHPRQQMTDAHLREVALVYRQAESKPTLAVMRRFDVSRPTAGRWLALARERGFLSPAPIRKARDQ